MEDILILLYVFCVCFVTTPFQSICQDVIINCLIFHLFYHFSRNQMKDVFTFRFEGLFFKEKKEQDYLAGKLFLDYLCGK